MVTATLSEEEAIRRAAEAQKQFEQLATQSLTGFISDLRSGKSAAEALSRVFDNIADQLIQMAAQGLIKNLFGGLFGGGGGIFGGIFGGGKATGGPVSSGTTYLVGEKGPELFTPSSAGNITPNHKLGGGGGSVAVEVVPSDYFDVKVRQISGTVATAVTSAGISSYDQGLNSRVMEKQAREGY